MVTVTLNGKQTEITHSHCLDEFLKQHGYAEQTIAVAINQQFIPKHRYTNTHLQSGDRIEIVSPMQGG